MQSESPEFIEKFQKTFASNIDDIDKKLGIHKSKIPSIKIVGKDCPRQQIWRNKLYPNYKGTRKNNTGVGNFFKMVYENDLFQKAGVQKIVSYHQLEADDCIAITAKHIYDKYPEANIWIITSDMDYLQLAQQRVQIIDLKGKSLIQKMNFDCSKKELLYKIILGDKSDNISSVFPKCGKITAKKLCNDIELFETKLETDEEYLKKYKFNKMLIDSLFICLKIILI